MIRGVIIHMAGEQPMLADLPGLPSAGDVCLTCTNLRLANGQRPVAIDRSDSTFLIPLVHVRFVEIPSEEREAVRTPVAEARGEEPPLELDEELLRRIRES